MVQKLIAVGEELMEVVKVQFVVESGVGFSE